MIHVYGARLAVLVKLCEPLVRGGEGAEAMNLNVHDFHKSSVKKSSTLVKDMEKCLKLRGPRVRLAQVGEILLSIFIFE